MGTGKPSRKDAKKGKGSSKSSEPLGLDLIGYWATGSVEDVTGYPHPAELVGSWDSEDQKNVLTYLRSGVVFRNYMGFSQCRLCSQSLGVTEMSDGSWAWPEGLEHYVEAHGVCLPDAFVESARALDWRVPQAAKRALGPPQLWIDGGSGSMPVGEPTGRPIFLRSEQWLDWAMSQTEPKPAADAITIDDARKACEALSHRTWSAKIDDVHGRWRVTCNGGDRPDVFYIERCSGTDLERRLMVWRYPDPDSLLDPNAAQAIAQEYDGRWGSARLVAGSEHLWLVWVKPPDAADPTEDEIKQVLDGQPRLGWSTSLPSGSEALPAPHMDERSWRFALQRIRTDHEKRREQEAEPKRGNGHPGSSPSSA